MARRRTKIVATLGPATDSQEILDQLIRAGVDLVRLNFSHGDAATHARRAEMARAAAQREGRHVGVLVDLQGPKIRIDCFKDNRKVQLQEGAQFVLDMDLPADAGDETQVGCAYKTLAQDVRSGDMLLLDDGRIELLVQSIHGVRIVCQVTVGGELSNKKGINRKGGGLSANALTDKDKEDIKTAVAIDADYIAVSFPRSGADMEEARGLVRAAGGAHIGLVAKIERAEALVALEEIVDASVAVMVARGDLGVEIGDAQIPEAQKRIIDAARSRNRAVITATQMMESMILNPLPTRAEVLDVANAVFDGTDAIMLSAETAAGKYPVKAVEAMHRVSLAAEQSPRVRNSNGRVNETFEHVDEAIAMAVMYVANHLVLDGHCVKAIAALTESGATAMCMSRISSGIPIFAMSAHERTCRKLTLYRGVYPMLFHRDTSDHAVLNKEVILEFKNTGVVTSDDDVVILTKGDLTGVQGGTNALKIARVGNAMALI